MDSAYEMERNLAEALQLGRIEPREEWVLHFLLVKRLLPREAALILDKSPRWVTNIRDRALTKLKEGRTT